MVKIEITEEIQRALKKVGDDINILETKIGSGLGAHSIKVLPQDVSYMIGRIDEITETVAVLKKMLENQ